MIRKIEPGDRELLRQWIAADDHHRDRLTADWWYQPRRISLTVVDWMGAVMFIKLEPEPPGIRLYIQFSPSTKRNAAGMMRDFDEVRNLCRTAGAAFMVFDTTNPKLAAFCHKAWGFERVGESNDYSLLLQGDQCEKAQS